MLFNVGCIGTNIKLSYDCMVDLFEAQNNCICDISNIYEDYLKSHEYDIFYFFD